MLWNFLNFMKIPKGENLTIEGVFWYCWFIIEVDGKLECSWKIKYKVIKKFFSLEILLIIRLYMGQLLYHTSLISNILQNWEKPSISQNLKIWKTYKNLYFLKTKTVFYCRTGANKIKSSEILKQGLPWKYHFTVV